MSLPKVVQWSQNNGYKYLKLKSKLDIGVSRRLTKNLVGNENMYIFNNWITICKNVPNTLKFVYSYIFLESTSNNLHLRFYIWRSKKLITYTHIYIYVFFIHILDK